MTQSRYIYLENCEIIKKTDSAILVSFYVNDEEEQEWFPLSQVEDNGEHLDEGDENVTVAITHWIANHKGIEVECW